MKCPICGAPLNGVQEEGFWKLKCTECPFEFGRSWFHKKSDLIKKFNELVNKQTK